LAALLISLCKESVPYDYQQLENMTAQQRIKIAQAAASSLAIPELV
jgi:hypothetical protein